MALPEVIDIVEKYLKEDWKDELFSYRKISWSRIKHNLLSEKRGDVIAMLYKKRIFKDSKLYRFFIGQNFRHFLKISSLLFNERFSPTKIFVYQPSTFFL